MLIGTEVSLRPTTIDDAQLLADWGNDPAYWGPLFNHWPTTRQDLERHITAPTPPDMRRYIIVGRDTAEPMGTIFYWNPFTFTHVFQGLEIGYAVHPAFRRRGVARQAACLLVNHLFDATPVARIQATTHVENEASQGVLEAAGMRREGAYRKVAFMHGRYVDLYLCAIVRDDWKDEASYRAARRPF